MKSLEYEKKIAVASIFIDGGGCAQPLSCVWLCDPVDCSPPGSSVHGDSPGKNTGIGCHALLQSIFPTQGPNLCLLQLLRESRWILCHWATWEALVEIYTEINGTNLVSFKPISIAWEIFSVWIHGGVNIQFSHTLLCRERLCPPQHHVLKPNPKCSGISRWSLWEGVRS